MIAPLVVNEVSRTPPLSRPEIVTASLEKSAVTRRPRSLGDGGGRPNVCHNAPDRAIGGQIELGVTPPQERPSIPPSVKSRRENASMHLTETVSLPSAATKP